MRVVREEGEEMVHQDYRRNAKEHVLGVAKLDEEAQKILTCQSFHQGIGGVPHGTLLLIVTLHAPLVVVLHVISGRNGEKLLATIKSGQNWAALM